MKQAEINNVWEKILMQTKFLFYVLLVASFMLAIIGCGSGAGDGSKLGAAVISTPDNPSNPPSSPTSITLTWDAPRTNTDGTILADLRGYNVYYGMSSGNYSDSVRLGNQTGVTISSLTAGTWCFTVKAYNLSGNESDFSNETCTII